MPAQIAAWTPGELEMALGFLAYELELELKRA